MIHPLVRDVFLDLGRHPAFQDLVRRLSAGSATTLSGLTTTAKALYSVLLWQTVSRPLIVVVDGNKQAEELFEALNAAAQNIDIREDPARMRPADVPVLLGNASRIRKAVGWRPEIPFERTLRDVLDDWRRRVARA